MVLDHKRWMATLSTIGCIILSALPLPTAAQEFTPLDKVIASENSDWNTMYIFQRCAAIHSAAVQRMQDSGRTDVAQIIDEQSSAVKLWVILTLKQAEKLGVADKQEDFTRRTTEMINVYNKIMEENYTLTGHAVSEEINGDLTTCVNLANAMTEMKSK